MDAFLTIPYEKSQKTLVKRTEEVLKHNISIEKRIQQESSFNVGIEWNDTTIYCDVMLLYPRYITPLQHKPFFKIQGSMQTTDHVQERQKRRNSALLTYISV